MPASTASLAERGAISRSARRTEPASRANTPVTTLIKVDLPAPFSPSSAWISPSPKVKSTSCSAFNAPKLLVRPRISSREGRVAGGAEQSVMTNYLGGTGSRRPHGVRAPAIDFRRPGERQDDGEIFGSVAETLLAVVDLLRIVGRGVELRFGLDPLRRRSALLLEGNDRVERRPGHVRRQLDGCVRFA